MEKCVICHKNVKENKSTNIDKRKYYVQGAGQLCENCYKKLYK